MPHVPGHPDENLFNRARRSVRERAEKLRSRVTQGGRKPKVTLEEAQASRQQGFRSGRPEPASPEGRAARERVARGGARTPPPDVTVDRTPRAPGRLARAGQIARRGLRLTGAGLATAGVEEALRETGETGPLSERTAEQARRGGLPAVAAFAEDTARNIPEGFRRVGQTFSNITRSVFGGDEREQPRDLGIPEEQAAGLRRETGVVNPDPLQAELTRNLRGGRTANPATALPRGQGFIIRNNPDGTQEVVRTFRGEPGAGEPTEARGLRQQPDQARGRGLARADVSSDPRIAGFQALAPVEARQISQTLQRNQQVLEAGGRPSAQDIAALSNAQANIARVGLESARVNIARDEAGAERTQQILEPLNLRSGRDRDQAIIGLSGEIGAGNRAAESSLRQILSSRVLEEADSGLLSTLLPDFLPGGGERGPIDAVTDFLTGREQQVGGGTFENLTIEDGIVKQRDGRVLFDLDDFSEAEAQALQRMILTDSQASDASGLRR